MVQYSVTSENTYKTDVKAQLIKFYDFYNNKEYHHKIIKDLNEEILRLILYTKHKIHISTIKWFWIK